MKNENTAAISLMPVAIANIVIFLGFGIYYISLMNYEFIIYLAVVLAAAGTIGATHKRVGYSRILLWGMSFWGLLHMAGGAFHLGPVRLYELILLPLSDKLPIFRYDQLVHIWGFGMTTLLCWELLRKHLTGVMPGFAIWLIVAMAGLGIGALNEIMEFFVAMSVPESGVGDYINTSLDLISDLIGAILVIIVIAHKKSKN